MQTMEYRLSYGQILSQNQIHSLKLLAMNGYELEQYLYQAQLENPFVQIDYDAGYDAVHETKEGTAQNNREIKEFNWSQVPDTETFRLYPFLRMQIKRPLSAYEEALLEKLTGEIDSRGYLTASNQELGAIFEEPEESIARMRTEILKLEPAGIGSENLQQCLLLQLEQRQKEAQPSGKSKDSGQIQKLCRQIISHDLKAISTGEFHKLAVKYRIPKDKITQAAAIIRSLNPIPLNGIGSQTSQYIVPDIIFEWKERQWIIRLNHTYISRIRLSGEYVSLFQNAGHEFDLHSRQYCREHLKSANLLMKSLEQREKTMLKLAEYLLKEQYGFFMGTALLKPMTMTEAASALGLHESTISRAVRDKYIRTPAGVFSMRSLFSKAIDNENQLGEAKIKQKILEIISREDKKNPLSDQKISDCLKASGITVARRTVAKYREELNISSTRSRKIERG